MTDTLPTPAPTVRTRSPLLVGLAVAGVVGTVVMLALLLITAGLYSGAADERDTALQQARTTAAQLRQAKAQNTEAATLLAQCSIAFDSQKDVSDRLRSATQDILQGVVDYARYQDSAAFDAVTSEVSDLADGINTDEAAIDSSSCV